MSMGRGYKIYEIKLPHGGDIYQEDDWNINIDDNFCCFYTAFSNALICSLYSFGKRIDLRYLSIFSL